MSRDEVIQIIMLVKSGEFNDLIVRDDLLIDGVDESFDYINSRRNIHDKWWCWY